MAHAHFYCDESGKTHSSPFVSFCGYIGNNDQWEQFRAKWRELRLFLGVPPIHVTAIMNSDKNEEWAKVKRKWGADWEKKRDEMLLGFANVVYDSKVACVGASIDCSAYKMFPKTMKATYQDAHYLAFQWTVLRSIEKVEWGDSEALLGLVMDDDQEKAIHCYQLFTSLKKQKPEIKKRISGICFSNDKFYPGLQAADMIAYEARNLMTKGEPKPSEFFLRLTSDGFSQPHLFNAATLGEFEKQF